MREVSSNTLGPNRFPLIALLGTEKCVNSFHILDGIFIEMARHGKSTTVTSSDAEW